MFRSLGATLIFCFLFATPVVASTRTWTGSVNALWSEPANWSPPGIPTSSDSLVFPHGVLRLAMLNDLPNGTSFGPMTFNDVYELFGNSLTLTGDVTGLGCDPDVRIGGPLTLDSVSLNTIDINGQTVTMRLARIYSIRGNGTIVSQATNPSDGIQINSDSPFAGDIVRGSSKGAVILYGSLPNANLTVDWLDQGIKNATVGNLTITASPLAGYVLPYEGGVLHTKALDVQGGVDTIFDASGPPTVIQVNGTVTLSGFLVLSSQGTPTPGQHFTIIDNDGTDAVMGVFTTWPGDGPPLPVPEGATVTSSQGYKFKISYKGGDGNDVVITALAATTTSISQSAASSVVGEPVNLTATVTSNSKITPSGSVTFSDSGLTLGTAPLVNGVATLTTPALAVGTHSIVANYAGDGDLVLASTSAVILHTVQRGSTTTSVTPDRNSITYGDSAKFTINVAAIPPSIGIQTGIVSLRVDGQEVATAPVVNGTVTIITPLLKAGTRIITAAYVGDNSFFGSESTPLQLSVTRAPTTIVVVPEQNPAPAGVPLKVNVTVRSAASVAPAGTVVATEGPTVIAQTAIAGSVMMTLTLDVGTHDVVFAYSGNDNLNSSETILSERITLPAVLIDGASIPEGDAGRTDARVTLHLSAPSVDVVRVNWTTLDGSAVGGEDYEPASGVVTFEAGETSRTVTIAILGDTKPEDDESFFVQLSNPINAVLATERATVVIRNDDATFKEVTVPYATVQNGSLTLDLDLPVIGPSPYPVIVWIPGFISYDADTTVVPALRETLRGYAVAVVRYRTPTTAHFPAQVDDLKAAVRWLRANATEYALDTQHIGLWGDGAGAHLASLLALSGDFTPPKENEAFSSAVQAVVDWNGATDLLSLNADGASCNVIDHDADSSPESQLIGCGLQTCATTAMSASPMTYVRSGVASFLIMHAGFDCYIAPNQSEKLYAAMISVGDDVSLKIYPTVGHIDPFWNSPQAFSVVDEFLDAKLKPRPPSRTRGVRH